MVEKRSETKLSVIECHWNTGQPNYLNTVQPDYLNTGQMDSILLSYVIVRYSNGWYLDPHCILSLKLVQLNLLSFYFSFKKYPLLFQLVIYVEV